MLFNPGYQLEDRAARQQRIDNVALAQRINKLATELQKRVTPEEFEDWRKVAGTILICNGNLSELAANINARLEELDNLSERAQETDLRSGG